MYYNISSHLLKYALPLIETSLTITFNTSIKNKSIPKFVELARATPIFNGGARSGKSNYHRPISIIASYLKAI